MKDKEKTARTKRTGAKNHEEEIKEYPVQTTFNRDDMRIRQEGADEDEIHTSHDKTGSRK